MEKEVEIRDLKYDLAKANYMIAFLQQENRQLKVNQMLMSKPRMGVEDEAGKGKKFIGLEKMEDSEVQVKTKRHRTKDMKRKGDKMSESSTLWSSKTLTNSLKKMLRKIESICWIKLISTWINSLKGPTGPPTYKGTWIGITTPGTRFVKLGLRA